jgi:sugar phosphate isomerase/epimerase
MKRRDFIAGVAGIGVAAVNSGWAQGPSQGARGAKHARIGIMSLSFDHLLKDVNMTAAGWLTVMGGISGRGTRGTSGDKPAAAPPTLDIMDVGEMFADRFGVHRIEMQHWHFPSTESAWLKNFRARLDKTKSRVSQINVMFGPNMTLTSDSAVGRLQGIDLTKRWIDIAEVVGCPIVMVQQGAPTRQNIPVGIATLSPMVKYGKSRNVLVSMEPLGGSQGSGEPSHVLLLEIIKGAGATATCDVGNFPGQAEQQDGIPKLMAVTSGNTHVKYNQAKYDLSQVLAGIEKLGYKGLYSIETSSSLAGTDVYEDTQRILDIILSTI